MADSLVSNRISLNVATSGNQFVGLKITNTERLITFPMCYNLEENEVSTEKLNKSQRMAILNLLSRINGCKKLKEGERIFEFNNQKSNSSMPLQSMIYIIEDFLERNTYYTEKEILYTTGKNGKISWNRTVKHIQPTASESGIAFLDFIVRKNHIQENQLITELHIYCVYKCFEVLGFLYTSILPEKGNLSESDILKDKKYFLGLIQEKIDNTHLESNIELFSAMYDFLNNFNVDAELNSATFGTKSFQTVWESMVEKLFSTVTENIKEKYFYPRTKWTFKKFRNAPLRPDTIMIEDDKCFILDSKYYSYSSKENEEDTEDVEEVSGSIPGSDSIQKQITYAEFIDREINNNSDNKRIGKYRFDAADIFNVFILPAKNKDKKFEYLGYATSEWKDNSKNYHYVHAITLDTKFLMTNGNKNSEALKKELIDFISKKSSLV